MATFSSTLSATGVFSRAANCSLICSYSRVSRSISAARATRAASSSASRFLRSSSRALAAAKTARNFSSAAFLGAIGAVGSSRNSLLPGATTRRRRSTKTASPFLLRTASVVTDFPSVNVAIKATPVFYYFSSFLSAVILYATSRAFIIIRPAKRLDTVSSPKISTNSSVAKSAKSAKDLMPA